MWNYCKPMCRYKVGLHLWAWEMMGEGTSRGPLLVGMVNINKGGPIRSGRTGVGMRVRGVPVRI